MKTFKIIFSLDKAASFILYFSILTFIIAFNFSDNPPSGWYQQFFPDLHGAFISDITFTDSLTGYAVTKRDTGGTSYILKSTNGGDNWFTVFTNINPFTKVQFLKTDINKGFACTDFVSGSGKLYKTTNGGKSWDIIISPLPGYHDMSVLNENEIWITADFAFDGGLYRTTDGGQNWELKYYNVLHNPEKIYMFNSSLGFMQLYRLFKTVNSGITWDTIANVNEKYDNMQFSDTMTGWRTDLIYFKIKKTTDGGQNWVTLTLPQISGSFLSGITNFCILSKDSLWGSGSKFINMQTFKGIVFKTTNGGLNWGMQTPDSAANIQQYDYINFVNNKIGWAYLLPPTGFHTIKGGSDSTFYVGISSNIKNSEQSYTLKQNYPNPFNPSTTIRYNIQNSNYTEIKIYDIRGKEVNILKNKKEYPGSYEVEFNGSGLPSGVYFYSLFLDGNLVDTKKMILIR